MMLDWIEVSPKRQMRRRMKRRLVARAREIGVVKGLGIWEENESPKGVKVVKDTPMVLGGNGLEETMIWKELPLEGFEERLRWIAC